MAQDIIITPGGDEPTIEFTGSSVTAPSVNLKVLGDSELSFEEGSNKLLYIGDDIGIGTTNPTEKLHVVGNAFVSNTITATLVSATTVSGSNIAEMDSILSTHENEITDLQGDVTGLDSRLTTAESDISLAEADITTLEASATDHESRISTLESAPGGTSDHGSLTGLGDDDHTQYVLADGSRSMDTLSVTGNINSSGSVYIPRGYSYAVNHLGGLYGLVGLDSANDRVFGDLTSNTGIRVRLDSPNIVFGTNNGAVVFSNGSLNTERARLNSDGSWQDADHTLDIRNSTNPQTLNLYNTYTDASNYERGVFKFNSNTLTIGTEALGTGVARSMDFQTSGATRMTIAEDGYVGIGNTNPTKTLQLGVPGTTQTTDLALAGYSDFGIQFYGHGTWSQANIRSGYNKCIHIYNEGVNNPNHTLELGKTTGAGATNIRIYSRNEDFLKIGTHATYPMHKIGSVSAGANYIGDMYIDTSYGVNQYRRFLFNDDGFFEASGIKALDASLTNTFAGNVAVGGNITVTGTVDGRDIAADGTKLDNHVASGSVHFTEASIHHGSIAGLGDDDHTQYVLATGSRSMNSLSVTGNISVTGTVDGRDIAADGTKLDNHVASGSVHFTEASIDHGSIAGLGDDDHTQYVLATGARSMNSLSVTGNISVTGTVDGRDIAADGTKLDNHVASGSVHFTEASIDHGSIAGLGDDDHTQYVLATGSRSMNSLSVTGNISVTGTVDGRDIAADGTKLDNHVASGSVHFTEASIDHGSIAGLGDDDHTQYLRADGTRALTGNISAGTNRITNLGDPVGTQDAVTAAWALTSFPLLAQNLLDLPDHDAARDNLGLSGMATVDDAPANGNTYGRKDNAWAQVDHGSIDGLDDDDHTQYVLATGARDITGDQRIDGALDVGNLSATWENMSLDVVWDHLLPHDQNGNWNGVAANGGSTYQQNQGATGGICEGVDIQGVMTATCGTGTASTAGGCKYHTNLSTYMIAGATHYFRCTANRATNIKVRFGICNDALGATATPNNGGYFEFDPATDTDMQVVTAAGGTRTTTSTSLAGTTFAGTFRWYAIKITDEGGGAIGVGFYDCTNGGTLLAKHTTNIPSSGTNRAMRAFIQSIGAGQTYGTMWLDIYGVYIADWLPQNFVH